MAQKESKTRALDIDVEAIVTTPCPKCGRDPHDPACPAAPAVKRPPRAAKTKAMEAISSPKKVRNPRRPAPAEDLVDEEDENTVNESDDDTEDEDSVDEEDEEEEEDEEDTPPRRSPKREALSVKPILRVGDRNYVYNGMTLQAWRSAVRKRLVRVYRNVRGYPTLQNLQFCGSPEGWVVCELLGVWPISIPTMRHEMQSHLSRHAHVELAQFMAQAERRFVMVVKAVRSMAACRQDPDTACEDLCELVELSNYESTIITDSIVKKLSKGTITNATRAVQKTAQLGLPSKLTEKLQKAISEGHDSSSKPSSKRFSKKRHGAGKKKFRSKN